MKFGKYFSTQIHVPWSKHYVDYKRLKQGLKTSTNFDQLLKDEVEKLNQFVQRAPLNPELLYHFCMLNYMALFKALKKRDKQHERFTKNQFFTWIQTTPFFTFFQTLDRPRKHVKLVVFDKDGTLIDLQHMFAAWLVKLVKKVEQNPTHRPALYQKLGFDPSTQTISSTSVLVTGTNDQLKDILVQHLLDTGFATSLVESRAYVTSMWLEQELTESELVPCGDLHRVFQELVDKNIKIAVCTSDDRRVTEQTLTLLGLDQYVQAVKCGDDPVSSKPSPEPLWQICQELNVAPENAVMIGDSISDIHAGLNAKYGTVIAVRTGGHNKEALQHADLILDSVNDLEW